MGAFILVMVGIVSLLAVIGSYDMLKQINNLPDDEDKE
jgi:hypothetical protein